MSNGRQFSAVAAFRHGIRSVVENIPAAFAMSWPWLVVGGLLSIYPYYVILTSSVVANESSSATFAEVAPALFAILFLVALFMVIFASIAVNWHRYILRDEWPTGANKLRFDRQVARYIGNLFLISLAVGLLLIIPMIVLTAVFGRDRAEPALGEFSLIKTAIAGVVSFIAGGVFFRYALQLPAVALGRRDYGIGLSARDTGGNFVQLGLLSVLSWLVNEAAQYGVLALVWASGAIGSNVALAISIAISFLMTWLLGLLGITLLSSLYGYFVENREF
jgi:hypothetical protein